MGPSQDNWSSANRLVHLALTTLAFGLAACTAKDPDPAPSTTASTTPATPAQTDEEIHVLPGEEIQAALDRAATDSRRKAVVVHAGTYRPRQPAQALIWFNARHDGITLRADGEVILIAENPAVADRNAPSFPDVVNHVVFFGDGISEKTVLSGFKITGANGFFTDVGSIEPDSETPALKKSLFFYADGGAVKIFGRSYPTIEDCEIYRNFAAPCAGGVSVEHRGFNDRAVTFRNCIFRENRAQITGSALDLLRGSAAIVENCLFVGNVSNTGEDFIGKRTGHEYNKQHGSGALTVFPGSRATVVRSTFVDNWNGVDDKGTANIYDRCLFWKNERRGGISPGGRYELDILDALRVTSCVFLGETNDLRGTIDRSTNIFGGPDPELDEQYRPRAPAYVDVGYRPVSR